MRIQLTSEKEKNLTENNVTERSGILQDQEKNSPDGNVQDIKSDIVEIRKKNYKY